MPVPWRCRHGAAQVEHTGPVGGEGRVHGPDLRERQAVETDGILLGQPHDGADGLVRLAKRHALAHEIISEIGCEQRGIGHGGGAAPGVHLQAREQAGEHIEAERGLVETVEDRRLVLLQVAVVGERQALHERQQRVQVALQARGLAAQQFARVGILLLRHERRAGAERVGQRHKAELRARPEDEILGDARKVHAGERAGGGELDEHVAVGHGIHGVLRHPRPAAPVDEAERLGGEFAVDGQRGAGDGAGAQRAPVGVVGHLGQALVVALEHLQPRQKVMRQRHRLRPLEVGVAGDEHVAVRLGHGQQRASRRRGASSAGPRTPA